MCWFQLIPTYSNLKFSLKFLTEFSTSAVWRFVIRTALLLKDCKILIIILSLIFIRTCVHAITTSHHRAHHTSSSPHPRVAHLEITVGFKLEVGRERSKADGVWVPAQCWTRASCSCYARTSIMVLAHYPGTRPGSGAGGGICEIWVYFSSFGGLGWCVFWTFSS